MSFFMPPKSPKKIAKKTNSNAQKTLSAAEKSFQKSFLQKIDAEDWQNLEPQHQDEILRTLFSLGQGFQGDTPFIDIQHKNNRSRIFLIVNDMAFIIDSITSLLAERGLLIETMLHPLLHIKRSQKGWVEDVKTSPQKDTQAQSYSYIELNRCLTTDEVDKLKTNLMAVLKDVKLGTQDWLKIKSELLKAKEDVAQAPWKEDNEKQETLEFLDYLHNDNFTLLGLCTYHLETKGAKKIYVKDNKTALGLLSNQRTPSLTLQDEECLIQNWSVRKKMPAVCMTKLSTLSSVHRRVPLDAIFIKRYDAKGVYCGDVLLVGLFTSVTYSRSLRGIPLLRWKSQKIIDRAGFEANSHEARALRHIIEKYPRDELLQIDLDSLHRICMSLMRLQERPRIAHFMRADEFGRTITALMYVPRDRFDTRMRLKFQTILEQDYQCHCQNFYSTVDDSPLVRILFILKGQITEKHLTLHDTIERKLQKEGRSWSEKLFTALQNHSSLSSQISDILVRYGQAFPVSYQEEYDEQVALQDILYLEKIHQDPSSILFHLDLNPLHDNTLSLKVYSGQKAIILSDILPILENMGLRVLSEYPYEISTDQNASLWIQDFHVRPLVQTDLKDLKTMKPLFEECLDKIWHGKIENDSLNKLVLLSGVSARQILILRSYIRYLRQGKINLSLPYLEQAVTDFPAIAKTLIDYFYVRFDPSFKRNRDKEQSALHDLLQQSFSQVKSLDQDRILRSLKKAIEASLRTNFFQKDAQGFDKDYISIKYDSSLAPELPDPRPYREIFVYSPRVEGVHLRGDKVARGGLRWSDRHEDFRSEVLGLMKAQQVKNAVIVPMGAKGGFVCKYPTKHMSRTDLQQEAIACYQIFIRGLLDITDNLIRDKIKKPADIVCHDDDDPYLVVAADKGTATFSDIANQLSLAYQFWLGDAFASGGSVGYDHKKMGITARGSWESVKRHFREMNHDTQSEEFDVVGVGDMGGDVFGNGLLQSDKIRLIAAFNHLHIFIDPNPDAAKSFKERGRLFREVKGWDHYDLKILSKGGRIFNRSDKSCALTPEIQARFHIEQKEIAPNELIQILLTAETDLLYFGGIGTYVKASRETHADATDRSNDSCRVNANQIRASVVGEGANLAMTQRARIEYAECGGRLNTDFIDNSAGVDTSDHEVNIKILLSSIAQKGTKPLSFSARNKLLETMTDEVAELVLRDNYQQTQALSLMELQASEHLQQHANFLSSLERDGLLRRHLEFLPDEETLDQRRKNNKGLTRPELSLLLSYAKIVFRKSLLQTNLPDHPDMMDWAIRYFPKALQKTYAKDIEAHKLKREIVATSITNAMVNRMGPTFVRLTMERTGASAEDVTTAFMAVRDAFSLKNMWDDIEALDNKVAALTQLRALRKVSRLAQRETAWFLTKLGRKVRREQDGKLYGQGVEFLRKNYKKLVSQTTLAAIEEQKRMWSDDGLPHHLAETIAVFKIIGSAPDIVKITSKHKTDLMQTATVYFAVGDLFNFEWLRSQAKHLQQDPNLPVPWGSQAMTGILDQFYAIQADLTAEILQTNRRSKTKLKAEDIVPKWFETAEAPIKTVYRLCQSMQQNNQADWSSLSFAEQNLRQLMQA
jgi:glutamate dehydrogenase